MLQQFSNTKQEEQNFLPLCSPCPVKKQSVMMRPVAFRRIILTFVEVLITDQMLTNNPEATPSVTSFLRQSKRRGALGQAGWA